MSVVTDLQASAGGDIVEQKGIASTKFSAAASGSAEPRKRRTRITSSVNWKMSLGKKETYKIWEVD